MPLRFHPEPGTIVLCNYDDVVIAPEMRKARPVVVVGPRLRRRPGLATIVSLSTTAPNPPDTYHCAIELAEPLPAPFGKACMWTKCDMIATVSLARLDRFKEARNRYRGPRRWVTGQVSEAQLKSIRAAILCGLGLPTLTNHLYSYLNCVPALLQHRAWRLPRKQQPASHRR